MRGPEGKRVFRVTVLVGYQGMKGVGNGEKVKRKVSSRDDLLGRNSREVSRMRCNVRQRAIDAAREDYPLPLGARRFATRRTRS